MLNLHWRWTDHVTPYVSTDKARMREKCFHDTVWKMYCAGWVSVQLQRKSLLEAFPLAALILTSAGTSDVASLQVQYQQLMIFLKELDRRERELRFRKWRPKVPVSAKWEQEQHSWTNGAVQSKSNLMVCFFRFPSCRQWWLFAIEANLSEIREKRRRGNWDFAVVRARDIQTYTSLYFRKLKGVPLSLEEKVPDENLVFLDNEILTLPSTRS